MVQYAPNNFINTKSAVKLHIYVCGKVWLSAIELENYLGYNYETR